MIKEKRFWFVILMLIILAFPVKLGLEKITELIIEKQVEKYIKAVYKRDLDLEIKKLKISFLNLLRLRLVAQIENLRLEGLLEVPSGRLIIKTIPLITKNQLVFKEILLIKPKINYHHNFIFKDSESKKQKKKKTRSFVYEHILANEASLILKNSNIKKDYQFTDLNLELNDLIVGMEKNDKAASYIIKNKEFDLKGTITLAKGHSSYSSKGQITNLDFGDLLTVLNSKDQGLSGLLNLENIELNSAGASPEELAAKLLVTGDLTVKDGSLYLLDYIVKTKKVVNSVLPVGKVFDLFEIVTNEVIEGINGKNYEESLTSDNSKFSSLKAKLEIKEQKIKLKDMQIDTPIMDITGSGYNSFDQMMSYSLEASLAKIPVLPIIIKGVKKVPIVLIDLHGFSYRRAKSILKLVDFKKEQK